MVVLARKRSERYRCTRKTKNKYFSDCFAHTPAPLAALSRFFTLFGFDDF